MGTIQSTDWTMQSGTLICGMDSPVSIDSSTMHGPFSRRMSWAPYGTLAGTTGGSWYNSELHGGKQMWSLTPRRYMGRLHVLQARHCYELLGKWKRRIRVYGRTRTRTQMRTRTRTWTRTRAKINNFFSPFQPFAV